MRRELEKVEQAADTAVGQVQDEAADAREARQQAETQAKAAVSYVEAIQRDVEKATGAVQKELQTVKKKVRGLDQSLQALSTQSIDEDFLMTQLAELQERSESELTRRKEEYAAQFQDQQQALDALKTQLQQVAAASRQERVNANSVAAILEAQVTALMNRVHELERERQAAESSHAQLKTELEEVTRRLDRKQEEEEHRLERKLVDMLEQHRQQQDPLPPQQQHHHQQQQQQQHSRYPPYNQYPEEHPATAEKLHRLGRDVHLIGEDLHCLTKHVEVCNGDLHMALTKKLGDLASEVFNALEFDAHRHMNEHKRLHDMVESALRDLCDLRESVDRRIRDLMSFSIQDLHDGMKRMEEDLRRMAAERRSRSRSPPCRLSSDAYSGQDRAYESRRSTSSFNNDQSTGSAPVPSYVGPTLPQRSRSRSRSRSNPRTRGQRITADRSQPREDRRSEPSMPSEPAVVAINNSRGSSPEPDRPPRHMETTQAPDVVEPSQSDAQVTAVVPAERVVRAEPQRRREEDEARPTSAQAHQPPPAPFSRSKRPRVSHEVIVIEDDESIDDPFVPPNRAPLDVVVEDEDTRPRTIVIHESADSASDEEMPDSSSPDRLRTLSDIHLGSLLYFCYGGAPDLDVEWTPFFSSLGASDCIEMSRAANFLRQYPGLHSFPIHLAQFIVQAIVVEAPGSGAQGLGLSDDNQVITTASPELVRVEYHKVLDKVRLAWAELLTSKLRKLSELSPQTADSVQFSVNPALAESNDRAVVVAGNEDHLKLAVTHSAWRRWQSESLWRLVRQHRFGANIPAFDGDMVASPGVYVFLLMFDPVQVSQLSPQSASFRLTNWGRALVIQLWDHLLSKLPYLLFADCSWLEKQTDTSGTLPPLGFCHMLGAVLAWNSFANKELAYSAELYSESVRLLLSSLRVSGVRVQDQERAANLTLDEATEIELVGVSTKLVYALQLDGFFEAAHAILTQVTSSASVAAVRVESTATEARVNTSRSTTISATATTN